MLVFSEQLAPLNAKTSYQDLESTTTAATPFCITAALMLAAIKRACSASSSVANVACSASLRVAATTVASYRAVVAQVSDGKRSYCFKFVARTGLQAKTGLKMGQIRMMLGPDVCCAVAMIAAREH